MAPEIFSEADARAEIRDRLKSARHHKSSRPGTIRGGAIEDIEFVVRDNRKYLRIPAGVHVPDEWRRAHGDKFYPIGRDGLHLPTIRGGSRQYFQDLLCEPPIANLTAVVATTETALWNVSNFSPINANDPRPGKIYRVTAGGIMSFGATGTLTITPRVGLVIGGITLGASVVALTTPGATTAHAWSLEMIVICRTVGAPGANSTLIGSGFFITGIPSAGSLPGSQVFGGTSATADISIATGIWMGWTLTVAGTVTPQYAYIQSLN